MWYKNNKTQYTSGKIYFRYLEYRYPFRYLNLHLERCKKINEELKEKERQIKLAELDLQADPIFQTVNLNLNQVEPVNEANMVMISGLASSVSKADISNHFCRAGTIFSSNGEFLPFPYNS